MASRILKINYMRVAEHLHEKLEEAQDPDTPEHQLPFDCVHGILSNLIARYENILTYPLETRVGILASGNPEHLTEQYAVARENDIPPEAEELTNILFEDLGSSHFEGAIISNVPGCVVWVKGVPMSLPLVLIEVS